MENEVGGEIQFRRESVRILKFSLLGGAATLTHLAIAIFAISILAIPAIPANLIAFAFAFMVSFFGHYFFTFSDLGGGVWKSMASFFLIAFCGFLINNSLLIWLLTQDLLGELPSVVIAVLIVPGVTFVAARSWAFRS